MIEFPKDFFWGAATSAYQTEGGNSHSDWWEWESKVGLPDKSGEACQHYQLYKEDFDLARKLNHNCHRLSLEWARIEPQKDYFSNEEIKHYSQVLDSLYEHSLTPIVTLHHFTNPIWFANLGGWLNKDNTKYFLRYAKRMAEEFCGKVRFWVTINEPMVYAYYSYILGQWPPQIKSFSLSRKVVKNMAEAHIQSYKIIHDVYKKKGLNPPLVSIAQNVQSFRPCKNTLRNKLGAYLRNRFYNLDFVNNAVRRNALDFIGINYYTWGPVETKSWLPQNLLLDVCTHDHHLKKNTLGWSIYPQGLKDVLLSFKRYNLPLFILENGICTEDDNLRWDFISEHLKSMHEAMEEGAKVFGYIYWSLLDNYEWDKGFAPRFGLVHVDYNTYSRIIKESAYKLAQVCKTGRLE